MILAVIGSRKYPNLQKVLDTLERYGSYFQPPSVHTLTVVSGGAPGIDAMAETWGHRQGFDVWSYRPHVHPAGGYEIVTVTPEGNQTIGSSWFPNFTSCAMYRNGLIVKDAQRVLAFWDGYSGGTQDGIEKALGIRPVGTDILKRDLEVILP